MITRIQLREIHRKELPLHLLELLCNSTDLWNCNDNSETYT